MSSEYIQKELKSIIEDKSFEYPLNLAMASAWIMGNLKGLNLKVLDTQKTSSLADFFILGSASNITQMQSMAETMMAELRRLNFTIRSAEGMNGADWILIDAGDVISHIFLDSSRPVYDLDRLWGDAKIVKIPEHYYSSGDEELAQRRPGNSEDDKDYF